jgi:TRAF3-interacting protein 1
MAEYWAPTIEILQGETPLVDKPKLKPELLQKPPFRFLHDVITAVRIPPYTLSVSPYRLD